MNAIVANFKKDFTVEWRNKGTLNSLFLYMFGAIYISYLSSEISGGGITKSSWATIFWLINLFTSLTLAQRSFQLNNRYISLYYYLVQKPENLFLSKLLFNLAISLMVMIPGGLLYGSLLGFPNEQYGIFILLIFVGCFGFSSSLTFLSSISSKAGTGASLLPILSFPVVVPLVITLVKATKLVLDGIDAGLIVERLSVTFLIGIISIALGSILFPFLWKS